MGAIVFNLTTAALLIVMFRCGVVLLGEHTATRRGVPWAAAGLTLVAVVGVIVQASWSGAFALLADDPTKRGWWRPMTAVFLQNNLAGAAWNLVTLAAIVALAEWAWGPVTMLAVFAAGALMPSHLDAVLGTGGRSDDPRNFVGSSGATYFLAATLAAALVVSFLRNRHRQDITPRRGWQPATARDALLGVTAPVAGLTMWWAQANGHGLVVVEGFVVGLLLALALGRASHARHS